MPPEAKVLIDQGGLVRKEAKRTQYSRQVSTFLRRLKTLEDEWRRGSSPDN
jgi:hypothetical protein